MIHHQLLINLGYQGAAIRMSEWKKHIKRTNKQTLCGKGLSGARLEVQSGKLRYTANSAQDVWGFYGPNLCKDCLTAYLRHRLSDKGKRMLHKARVLEWLRLHGRRS
jgi:hypothetical protein